MGERPTLFDVKWTKGIGFMAKKSMPEFDCPKCGTDIYERTPNGEADVEYVHHFDNLKIICARCGYKWMTDVPHPETALVKEQRMTEYYRKIQAEANDIPKYEPPWKFWKWRF